MSKPVKKKTASNGAPAAKRKAANGYKLAERLPEGELLQDMTKKQWIIGKSIGQGGFGEIYSACKADDKTGKYPYVIKIEPHSNGPLYVEMQFYMRNAKEDEIKSFMQEKGLKTFGMPAYLGAGSHEFNGEKYRFVVMEKFGTDLWKLFLECGRQFPRSTVYKVAIQILDVLEYIHRHGYVHADIKGANILMGQTKETINKQVYLVDFGLATKYTNDKEFKANPKKAHDGTIEYLSRDAHLGVQTRRGDLEILLYNVIQWLGCKLPWEKNLTDPKTVQSHKEKCMNSANEMIKSCFGNTEAPEPVKKFLNYLLSLKFNEEPDYKKIRSFFLDGIKLEGDTFNSELAFSTTSARKSLKRRSSVKLVVAAKKVKTAKKPSVPKTKAVVRKKKNVADSQSTSTTDGMENLTPAMREILAKRNRKEGKENKADNSFNTDGFTDEMKEVLLKKKARQAAAGKKKAVRKSPAKTIKKTDVDGAVGSSNARPRRQARNKPVVDVSDSE